MSEMSDDSAPVASDPVPDLNHPLDALEFGDQTPTEAKKDLLQAKQEAPTAIQVINGVTYTTTGVTPVGVEKQWSAPDLTTTESGDVQVTHSAPAIDPISGVNQ